MIASKRAMHRRRDQDNQARARRTVDAMIEEAIEAKAPCLECGEQVTQGDVLPLGRGHPPPVCHKHCYGQYSRLKFKEGGT